jgi:predicted nucleic acid-binding protein
LRKRALAIARRAQRERAERVVPLPVLAEVYRGDASDACVDRLFVNGVRRLALDLRTTRLAGQLRSGAGTGSAVDAIVVASAIRLGGGIVATVDSDDLKRLAATTRTWPSGRSRRDDGTLDERQLSRTAKVSRVFRRRVHRGGRVAVDVARAGFGQGAQRDKQADVGAAVGTERPTLTHDWVAFGAPVQSDDQCRFLRSRSQAPGPL